MRISSGICLVNGIVLREFISIQIESLEHIHSLSGLFVTSHFGDDGIIILEKQFLFS